MKVMKMLAWFSTLVVVVLWIALALPIDIKYSLMRTGFSTNDVRFASFFLFVISGFCNAVLVFLTHQSIAKSRVIQDQRFFIESTHGIEEMVRQTYARFGAEEGVARQKVATLALEGETMDEAIQAAPAAQDYIVRRRRYERVAASLNFKIAKA
jgi:hypothetical protein